MRTRGPVVPGGNDRRRNVSAGSRGAAGNAGRVDASERLRDFPIAKLDDNANQCEHRAHGDRGGAHREH
jgi:hypothetical protein